MPKDALRTAKMPRKGSRQADATEGCIVCAGFHGKQRDLKNNASVLNNVLQPPAFAVSFDALMRGGGLGSRPIFKKFHETYAPS